MGSVHTHPPFLCALAFGGAQAQCRSRTRLGTYILGAQSAFEHGREVMVEDVIEAIELQAAGAYDLKTSVAASGFVRHPEPSASRK